MKLRHRIRRLTPVLVGSLLASVLASGAALVPHPAMAVPGAGELHAVNPHRVLDTRLSGGPLPGKGSRAVTLVGVDGLPSTAVAAVLNVTVTNTAVPGYLTVYPTGHAQPSTSSLNWNAGQTVATLVEVGIGSDGTVTLYNFQGTTDVVVDLSGWYDGAGPAPAGLYRAVTAARVADTRTGLGGVSGPLGPGAIRTFQVAGRGNVPAAAAAVALNLTATDGSAGGYLTVWPSDQSRPTASTLNFPAGGVVANRAIVQLSAAGSVSVYNLDGWTNVVIDVGGWYTGGSDPTATGGEFVPVAPVRILDTRLGQGAPAPGQGGRIAFPVVGQGGLPGSGVGAVALSVTSTGGTAGSYFTLFPDGTARTASSDLNFASGGLATNAVIVAPGGSGMVDLYNSLGVAQAVADVVGYYTPFPLPTPLPSAPLAVSAVAGDRSATVSWTAPAAPGGSQVVSYQVTAQPGGATAVTGADHTSLVFPGLVNQSSYTFTVTALNGAGSGPDSVPSAAAIPLGTPDPPTGLVAGAGYGTYTVSWTPPANNGGSPILGFQLVAWPAGSLATPTMSTTITLMVPAGQYWFTVRATNAYGTGPDSAPSNPVMVAGPHLILVSLSAQHMWVYDGGALVRETDVATGRPELPTPPGDYHIFYKQSPATFISPWPTWSPFWYPNSDVSWEMEFLAGGYFIHDAPWRSWFGPGSDSIDGTHGCVNVPTDVMGWLYGWAQVGDEVQVTP